MKTKPEIILNQTKQIYYKRILVTGSDEPLITHVGDYFVKKFKNEKYYIDRSGVYNKGLAGDLFSDKKVLFVLKDYFEKKGGGEILCSYDRPVLIVSSNKKNVSAIRSRLLKSKDDLVVDCYPLTRSSKEIVLKNFIENAKINLSNEAFWYVIENLDDNYVLFIKQLEVLSLSKNSIDSAEDVERAVFIENKIELSKIFFHIFRNNKFLINVFNQNIYSQADFNIFLRSTKTYLKIISNSPKKEDAVAAFPRYLFNEKDIFLKIYKQLDKKKIIKIYKNIMKVELLLRKNSNLYFVIGLRFLLNTKKIIIS
jgi:hypothetical protein